MKVTVEIPDKLYEDLKKSERNVEQSIIEAVEEYTAKKIALADDPFHKWVMTPMPDKEGKTDIAANHDKYLYGS